MNARPTNIIDRMLLLRTAVVVISLGGMLVARSIIRSPSEPPGILQMPIILSFGLSPCWMPIAFFAYLGRRDLTARSVATFALFQATAIGAVYLLDSLR